MLALITTRRLYGFTILQTMQYFDRFYNDHRLSKLLVRRVCELYVHPTCSPISDHSSSRLYYSCEADMDHELLCVPT